jgi:endonuclease I
MKNKLLLLTFFITELSFAQIPVGYYSTATGSGYNLKTQLYNIIKGHSNIGYDALWTAFSTTDRDIVYENDNSILDIYSENPSGPDPVTFIYSINQCGAYTAQGQCYNREHIIPQSIYNSLTPMVSDAHVVIPVDGFVNGMRSNNPHGKVASASWTSLNGSKSGTSAVSGYTGTVFEPVQEFKGDIARMYFYFATRYENLVASYTSFPMFNGTSNQVFSLPFLDMLVSWHNQDPVSTREINRNNAIYSLQNNRNPFIDHPAYVANIWGTNLAQTITFSPLTNSIYGNSNFNLSAFASSGLPVSYTSTNTNVATISGNTVTIIGVGNTSIVASQVGNSTYAPASSVSQMLTVLPKVLTVNVNANNKVYDRTLSASMAGSLQGVVGNDVIQLSTSGSFVTANAGTNIPISIVCSISGAKASNYTLSQPTGVIANIIPRQIFMQ